MGLRDIIHAGHGDRYQVCTLLFTDISEIPKPSPMLFVTLLDCCHSKRSVGTAPWATAKFEDVEKKLVSPRESEKNDIFKKTSEAYMPVLDAQKSFGKYRKDETVQASKHAD